MLFSAVIAPGTFPSNTAILQGPLSEVLPRAKAIGFDGVQLTIRTAADFDLAALKSSCQALGLRVTALATGRVYTVDGLSMGSGDEAVRQRCTQRLIELAGVCRELGGAALIIGACRGRTSDAPTRERYQEQFQKSLREVCTAAARLAVPVRLELIDHLESDCCYQLAPTLAVIQETGAENLSIYFDTEHLWVEGEDIPALLRAEGGRASQIDVSGEERRPPYASKIDFKAALQAAREGGFDGVLAFEVDGHFDPDVAEKSLRYVKELLA